MQVLETASGYNTTKKICIATDKPSRLAKEVARWAFPHVIVCSHPTSLTTLVQPGMDIAALHWHHMYAASKTGKLSSCKSCPCCVV